MRQVYARYPILVFSSLQDVCKYFAANQEGLLETKHRLVIVSAPSKYLYEKGIYAVDLSYDDKDKFIIKKRERVSAFRIFKAMLKRDFVFDDMEQQYQTKMSGLVYTMDDVNKPLPKVNQYLREVVHKIKQGSFLTPFMTFIYRLPYSTHQKPIKRLFINWLFYSGEEEDIYAAIAFLQKYNDVFKLPPRVLTALQKALNLPNIRQYAKAFEFLRKHPKTSHKELIAMYHIDIYEINYMIAVTNSDIDMLTTSDGRVLTFQRYFEKLQQVRTTKHA
jgi:hypothetical protein